MGFNQSKFMNQQFEPRTAQVAVPTLSDWFDGNEEPVWTVRGLTAEEVARCNEGANTQKTLSTLIEAIGNSKADITVIKEQLGITNNEVPQDTIQRIERILVGTVMEGEEKLDRTTVVKIATTRVGVFMQLSNKVMELTALGMEASIKKREVSGRTKK